MASYLYGKFHCCDCDRSWSSYKARKGGSQECDNCGHRVQPYQLRPSVNLVYCESGIKCYVKHFCIQDYIRMFGKFRCHYCGKRWSSASAWKGVSQGCKGCHSYIKPYQSRFLKHKKEDGKRDKQHIQDLCTMCQILGTNCTRYSSVIEKEEEELKEEEEEYEEEEKYENKDRIVYFEEDDNDDENCGHGDHDYWYNQDYKSRQGRYDYRHCRKGL